MSDWQGPRAKCSESNFALVAGSHFPVILPLWLVICLLLGARTVTPQRELRGVSMFRRRGLIVHEMSHPSDNGNREYGPPSRAEG